MSIYSLLLSVVQTVPAYGGFAGDPIPYTLRNDDILVILLLICFAVSAGALYFGKQFLIQQCRIFLFHRDRASIFSDTSSSDMRYSLGLLLQTCLLSGIVVFACSETFQPINGKAHSSLALIGLYACLFLIYYVLKWLVYYFLGWIYIDKIKTKNWLDSYLLLIYSFGFLLFIFVLSLIYLDLTSSIILILGTFLFIFAKLLIFYKWFKLFLSNLSGVLLLILYFCALEITPCLLLYQGIIQINRF